MATFALTILGFMAWNEMFFTREERRKDEKKTKKD